MVLFKACLALLWWIVKQINAKQGVPQWNDFVEECYNIIKELQINRENTLIFCNNGYQRSLPFICNYLITHHNDEVPNLDRALDIVLSQADKTNFSNIKEPTKNNLLNLKKEDGSVLFK